MPSWVRQHLAALRLLLAFTVVFGIGYPLVVTAIAQIPGLQHRANGELISYQGKVVGSAEIGQLFTDSKGDPIAKYFQSRPSAAGDGYDPTSTSASNLGPESIIDTLADPSVKGDSGTPALLSDVCSRSLAVGQENGVNGLRPYCTSTGIGAVLSVIHANGVTGKVVKVVSVNQECPTTPFIATYDGRPVQCATYGVDYRVGRIVLVHGAGTSWPANPVPPDAVTASGSGLDPDISVAYADLQAKRVADARGLTIKNVLTLVKKYTSQRTLGFMGEPAVNVLQLNLALDKLSKQ